MLSRHGFQRIGFEYHAERRAYAARSAAHAHEGTRTAGNQGSPIDAFKNPIVAYGTSKVPVRCKHHSRYQAVVLRPMERD